MPNVYVPERERQRRDWTNAKLFVGGMLLGCVLIPLFIGWAWVADAMLHGVR